MSTHTETPSPFSREGIAYQETAGQGHEKKNDKNKHAPRGMKHAHEQVPKTSVVEQGPNKKTPRWKKVVVGLAVAGAVPLAVKGYQIDSQQKADEARAEQRQERIEERQERMEERQQFAETRQELKYVFNNLDPNLVSQSEITGFRIGKVYDHPSKEMVKKLYMEPDAPVTMLEVTVNREDHDAMDEVQEPVQVKADGTEARIVWEPGTISAIGHDAVESKWAAWPMEIGESDEKDAGALNNWELPLEEGENTYYIPIQNAADDPRSRVWNVRFDNYGKFTLEGLSKRPEVWTYAQEVGKIQVEFNQDGEVGAITLLPDEKAEEA